MRRLVWWLLLLFLLAPGQAWAVDCSGFEGHLSPKGYQQLTVSTTAVSLTVPAGTQMAVVLNETQPVRYRDDGVAPTASVGVLVGAGQALSVCSAAVTAIQFIRQGATDSLMSISYYGGGG